MLKINAYLQRYPGRGIVVDEVVVDLEPDKLGGSDYFAYGRERLNETIIEPAMRPANLINTGPLITLEPLLLPGRRSYPAFSSTFPLTTARGNANRSLCLRIAANNLRVTTTSVS